MFQRRNHRNGGRHHGLGTLAATTALTLPATAFGQSAAPGAAIELPPVVITAPAQIKPAPKPKKKVKKTTKKTTGFVASSQTTSYSAAATPSEVAASGSDLVPFDTVSTAMSPATAAARRKLDAIAGGATVIAGQDLSPKASITLAEQLASVPGIVVQKFLGGNDQPRVQIRGSGLQQNPVERGLLVLQDGLPINRADGSYIVGFADPRSAEFTEVYKGYTANRLGATVLGGAINFVSHNGATSPGGEFSIEGGSFGHLATTARMGATDGKFDGHAAFSYSQRDGFRNHNESDRFNFNVNAGARINENIRTRLYFGYTDLAFDVAGPLSWALLKDNPKQNCSGPPNCMGPNVPRDLPQREAHQFRAGSRTTAKFGANLVDVGLGYTYTDDSFRFPISGGVRDTEGGDFTTVVRYAFQPNAATTLPLFEITGQYVVGSADRAHYTNNRGRRGALVGKNDLDASTLSIYAGFNIPLADRLTLSPALSYSYATRDSDDNYGLGPRPVLLPNGAVVTPPPTIQDTSYDHSYTGWSPSLALSYELARNNTIFAAVSRSFEPPTHDDLSATINGNPNASPGFDINGNIAPNPNFGPAFATPDLDAQTATTLEGGWKGRNDRFAWSVIAYHSWVKDELLNLRDASGVPLGAVNADRTTHFGIELGGSAKLTEEIGVRLAYTYQDFRFNGDRNHGDNRLAGAPRHLINAALRYNFTSNIFLVAEATWIPDETPVDNANTLFNQNYVVVDLRGYYGITENFGLYGEVSNLFDEVYASSTLIVDSVSNPNQSTFLPGEGRAFLAGVRARF